MLKIVNRHPFTFGVMVGFIGVGIIGKNLKKLIAGKITIISIDLGKEEQPKTDPKENK